MLKVSTKKDEKPQAPLFEGYEDDNDRVLTVAACRNFMGDFFEELTAQIVGASRLKTDSRADICPDLLITHSKFVECKSVGCTGSIIVYEARLEKDLSFCKENAVELFYCFWHHKARIADGVTLGELREGAAKSIRSVTIIPLHDLANRLKGDFIPKQMSHKGPTRRGYGSYGYTSGYQVRLALVRDRYLPFRYPKPIEVEVYGKPVLLTDFQVFTCRRIQLLIKRLSNGKQATSMGL